jgi:hypothetical protein
LKPKNDVEAEFFKNFWLPLINMKKVSEEGKLISLNYFLENEK